MKMKKAAALIMAAVMAMSLTACGGTDSEKKSKDIGTKTEDKDSGGSGETLSVSIWDVNQEPGIKEILGDFTKKTGIKTTLQVVAWEEYWTMLSAGAQGGTLPDVFWMHSNESQRYMSNDMLLDLTDKIEESKEIDPENYPKDIWGLYTYEDKMYAVPKDVDTIALWYNKTMFEEAGVAFPDDTWTWDNLIEAAQKLTKADGSQYGFALRNDNTQAGFYNMVYDSGGYIINDEKTESGLDDPKTIEGMQILETLIKNGSMPSLETMAETGEEVLFSSGKAAMIMQGSWMVAYHRDNEYSSANADIAVIPKAKDGTRKTIYNGLGWAAAANGEHTDEAWQLIEYLGSKEAQEKQAELGVTMSAYNETSDAWADNVPKFNLKAYLEVMVPEAMVIRPYSKTTVTWEGKVIDGLKAVYGGTKTMEEFCKTAAEEMNAVLAEE